MRYRYKKKFRDTLFAYDNIHITFLKKIARKEKFKYY